jgi:hypothetical protein
LGSETQSILSRHVVCGGIPGIKRERADRSFKGFVQLVQVARGLGLQKPGVRVTGIQARGRFKLLESFSVMMQGQVAGPGE